MPSEALPLTALNTLLRAIMNEGAPLWSNWIHVSILLFWLHRQHLFNIAEAQGEAEVQPNGMTDDLGREAMTMVRRYGGAHQSSMPQENLRLHLRLLT